MYFNDLKGKTAMITGCGQGIGEGIAKGFLENGANLILCARNEISWLDKLQTKNEINTIISDIRNSSLLNELIKELEKKGKQIDILVNNAGILIEKELLDITEDDWDTLIDVNVKSLFFLSKEIVRHMIKNNNGGVIVNAASFGASIPSYMAGIYACSKSAALTLTKCMAAEWARYGIRVNAFSPGVFPTKMTRNAIEKNRERMLEDIALHRFGDISEVVDCVLFLSSDLSRYLTGINLDVSGGKLIIQNPGVAWK